MQPKTDTAKSTPDRHNPSWEELMERVISYQFQTGIDPSVGDVIGDIAEMMRRLKDGEY